MLLLYLPLLVVLFFTPIIFRLLLGSWRTTRAHQHLPWVGTKNRTWWALQYSRFANVVRIKRDHAAMCDKYWLKERACFIPLIFGDSVILPPSDFEWALDLPEDSISLHEQVCQFHQGKYTICSDYVLNTLYLDKSIFRDLPRRVGDLIPDIFEEVALAIDQEWGTEPGVWKDVNPFTTLIKVVARASNRVFVGAPLCRDPAFFETAIDLATSVMPCAFLIRLFPKWLEPIAAPLITFKNRVYRRKLAEILRPEISRRLKEASERTGEHKFTAKSDYLQWAINAALKSDLPRDTDIDTLVGRIIIINFAAIHTTTITITNAIFDLASHRFTQDNITSLREEADAALAANHGLWTKSAMAQLLKIDSTLKESNRLDNHSPFGWHRMVTNPGGLTAPVSGTFIPQGTSIGFPLQMAHHDASKYPDPEAYQPLRFVDQNPTTTTKQEETEGDTLNGSSIPRAPKQSATTTSQSYFHFGHGRHACPGRFFATHEMKLLIAYVVQNYDFDLLEKRPEPTWIGAMIMCPMDKTIRIRRKEKH